MAVLGDSDVDMGATAVETIDRRPTNAPSSDRPRLAHEPALDGLRGLAVVAVFLFHLERLDGGFLGVDLFFVLSGFLITSLLVVEHQTRGRIDLRRFWARRARRLLPALLGLLVGVAVLLLAFTPADQRARFRGDALATLGYVANWHRMSTDLAYWDIFEQPSPLDHTWSLAIEEQFYVAWPLVAVAALALATRRLRRRRHGRDDRAGDLAGAEIPGSGVDAAGVGPGDAGRDRRPGLADADRSGRARSPRRLLGWLALGGAAVSFGLLALAYSPVETDRAYYGTDTRIGATLLGAALALFSARRAAAKATTASTGGSNGPLTNPAPTPNGESGDPNDGGTDFHIGGSRDGQAVDHAVTPPNAGDAVTRAGLLGRLVAAIGSRGRDAQKSSPGWAALGLEALGFVGLGWMGWSVVTVDGVSPWYYRGGLLLFAVAAVVVIQAVTGGRRGLLGRVVGWAPLRGLGIISYGVYLWHWPVKVYMTPERARLDGWALDGARVVATLVVALASFWLVEQPIRRGALRGRALYAVSGGALAVTLAAVLVSTAGTRSSTTGTDAAHGFGPVPVEGSDNPYLLYPSEIPPDATRVLLVGDSGAFFLGPILAAEGERAGFAVASSAPYWCNIALPEGLMRFSDGEIMDRGNCQDRRREVLRDLVDELQPDAVVYYLANAGGPGEMWVDGEWTEDCQPTYDDYLTRALQEDVDLLSADGAHVVLATSPYTNVINEDALPRTDCRNATFRRVAESRPGRATVVDMNAYVAQQRAAGVEMFQDLVHLSPEGSRLVSHWLFPQLQALAASGP